MAAEWRACRAKLRLRSCGIAKEAAPALDQRCVNDLCSVACGWRIRLSLRWSIRHDVSAYSSRQVIDVSVLLGEQTS